MPVKNKRGQKAPSQTLHNFFLVKPASAHSQEVQVTPSAKKTPAREPKSTIEHLAQKDVIVIDSDSDNDSAEVLECINAKRRKLSPRNTGANFCLTIEGSSSGTTHDVSGSIISESKENLSLDVKKRLGTNSRHDTKSQGEIHFGIPFLLVHDKPQDHTPTQPCESFGNPLGALGQMSSATSINTSYIATASSSKVTSKETIEEENERMKEEAVDVDFTMGDWELGDDEDDGQRNADEDSDIEVSEIIPCKPPNNGDYNTMRDPKSTDLQNAVLLQKQHRPLIFETDSNRSTSKSLPALSSVLSTTSTRLGSINTEEKPRKNNGDAFSVLMTSLKDNEIWNEASLAERKVAPQQKYKGNRRKAPFYKVLTGMPIAVDAFRYGAIPGVTAYFLTHAHSDHYTNLSSSWKHGPIYCSQGTANLIIHMLSVDPKWVHPLPMDTPTLIPNTNGVTVTLIEANHCPGSSLFFFEGLQTVNAGDSTFKSSFVGSPRTFRYLHCGDFRASPQHVLHPAVRDKVIDLVYLDTTYLDPKYTFPPQPLVISACAEVARRAVCGQLVEDKKSTMFSWMTSESKGKEKEQPKSLVVVGTYSIGKERIVKAIAHALNSKVYCDKRKAAILRCQGDAELDDLLTSNPLEAIVHLVPLSTIDSDHMKTYLDRFKGSFNKIIGFRPTGWTYTQASGTNQLPSIPSILAKAASLQNFKHTDLKVSAKSTTTLQLYPVPYSEHSSFYELTCFAMSFNWVKMVATVNVGSETSRGKMAKWVAKWEAERKKRSKDTIVPHRHPDYW